MRLRTLSHVGALALLATAMLSAQGRQPQTPPPAVANALAHNLSVTVKYTGKGVIDATHAVMVFLFTTPNFKASQPVNVQVVTKNGDVASFIAIPQSTVYVVAVYDDKGTYTGQQGPPPIGAPIGQYAIPAKPTEPAPVTVGPKTAITLTFDGSMKFSM